MPDRFARRPRPVRPLLSRAAIAAALAAAAACAPPPTPNEVNFADEGNAQGVAAASRTPRSALDDIAIGKSINDDNTIGDDTRTFAATDPVFASARVSGPANSGIVRAVWFDPQGQPLVEQTRIVTPSRGETIALEGKRESGWKPGEHTVEIFLDDRLMATERFTVEGSAQHGGTNPLH
jgi:hypothetical protein